MSLFCQTVWPHHSGDKNRLSNGENSEDRGVAGAARSASKSFHYVALNVVRKQKKTFL